MQHSKVGASSAYRWMKCPGSVALIEQAPPQESSPYAEEGTAAHELAEECLRNGENAADHIGTVYNSYEVTEEMAEAVQIYLDAVRSDVKTLGLTEEHLQVEKRFHLDDIDEDCFGTNDACIGEPFGKLIVHDYKHGQGKVVEVEENPQLMYYALGAMKGEDYEEIELVVTQPRAYHPDGPVRRWKTSPERLLSFADELRKSVAATREKDARIEAGDHCKFCPALAICPAVRGHAQELANIDFENFSMEPVLPRPDTFRVEELGNVLNSIKLIRDWFTEVEKYAQHLALNGTEVPGHKLVAKRAHRKWIDENDVIDHLFDEYGDEIFVAPKLKSPAQMEKLEGADKEIIAGLTMTPDNGLTLAHESDRRRAVELPANKFDNFQLEEGENNE